MTHLDVETFGDLDALAAGDPRREHLETCAFCQARYEAYLDFLAVHAPAPGSDPTAARAELRSAVRDQLRTEAGRHAATVGPPRWWSMLLRPATVTGILAVAVLVFVGLRNEPLRKQPMTLRGDSLPAAEGEVALVLAEPRDGRTLSLAWRAVPGADAYEIRVLAVDLSVLATRAVGRDTFATFGPESLAIARYVMVVGLAGGNAIADSRPVSLPGP